MMNFKRIKEKGISTIISSILLIVLIIGVTAGIYSYTSNTNLQNTPPQSQLQTKLQGENLIFTHNGGDTINMEKLSITINNTSYSLSNNEDLKAGQVITESLPDNIQDGDTIKIIYDNQYKLSTTGEFIKENEITENETTENETLEIVYKTQLSIENDDLGSAGINPNGDNIISASINNLYMYGFDGESWNVSQTYENWEHSSSTGDVVWEGEWIAFNTFSNLHVFDTEDANNFEDWNTIPNSTYNSSDFSISMTSDGYLITENTIGSNDSNIYVIDADDESLPQVNSYDLDSLSSSKFGGKCGDIIFDGDYFFIGDNAGYIHVFEYLNEGELSYSQYIDTKVDDSVVGLSREGDYLSFTYYNTHNIFVMESDDFSSDVSFVDNITIDNPNIDTVLFEGEKVLTSEYENASYLYSFENGDLILENEYEIIKLIFDKSSSGNGEGKLVVSSNSEDNVDIYSYEFKS